MWEEIYICVLISLLSNVIGYMYNYFVISKTKPMLQFLMNVWSKMKGILYGNTSRTLPPQVSQTNLCTTLPSSNVGVNVSPLLVSSLNEKKEYKVQINTTDTENTMSNFARVSSLPSLHALTPQIISLPSKSETLGISRISRSQPVTPLTSPSSSVGGKIVFTRNYPFLSSPFSGFSQHLEEFIIKNNENVAPLSPIDYPEKSRTTRSTREQGTQTENRINPLTIFSIPYVPFRQLYTKTGDTNKNIIKEDEENKN